MTYQQITIVGNVGRDPELRYTQGGNAVTDFSVAVNSGYTDSQGQRVERTTWYRVTCWGRLAETAASYLKKGRQVLVVGDRIEANAYTGRDGSARASLDLTANVVRFLGNRNDVANMGDDQGVDAASGGYPTNNDFAAPDAPGEENDIPF